MSKHFHGQAHFKGGFDIDESTLNDDANYWRSGAEGARDALAKLTNNWYQKVAHIWQ